MPSFMAREGDDPYRAALERLVREGAATGRRKTFVAVVQEGQGNWLISVPDLPGARCRVAKRSEMESAARALIASELQVPAHFFDLHLRFED
jgi:hypothetical protein